MPVPFDTLKNFGKVMKDKARYRDFTPEDAARLGPRLPPSLLKLLEKDGFASYLGGAIWTCDPDELNRHAAPWRPNERAYEVFMRTSFGDFFVWDGQWVWFAIIHDARVLYCIHDMDWFLGRFIVEKGFLPKTDVLKDHAKATKKLGPLAPDECYFWTPALALGGSRSDSTIEKGSMATTLSLVSQLARPTIQRV